MTEKTLLTKIDAIESKIESILYEIKEVKKDTESLRDTVKTDYVQKYVTQDLDKRVSKGESLWDWFIKIVFGLLVTGMLALLGLRK